MGKAHTFRHIVDKHTLKYNERYEEHRDSHLALGWPSEVDNRKRFGVMLDIMSLAYHAHPITLLDFGCGLGHLIERLPDNEIGREIEYTGLDINPDFVNTCYAKYPNMTFLSLDILDDESFGILPEFDYIICNGVFTEKLDTPWQEQWDYFTTIIQLLWRRTKHGLVFNLMSPVVDYERDDLFHVPFDKVAQFVKSVLCSRHFVFRHDYGLWEYTTYAYRE